MAVCEHARVGIDIEIANGRCRKTGKVSRISPAEERHAGPTQEGWAGDKRLYHPSSPFISRRTVDGRDRYVVESQINTELPAMVDEMVQDERSKSGDTRHREHDLTVALQGPERLILRIRLV